MKTAILMLFIFTGMLFAEDKPNCGDPEATLVGRTEDCHATYPHTPAVTYPADSSNTVKDTCTSTNPGGKRYFSTTSTVKASGFCAYSRDQDNTAKVCAGVYELQIIKAAISTDHDQFYNRGFDQIMNTNNGPSSLWPCERSGGFHTDYKECLGVACADPPSGNPIGGGGCIPGTEGMTGPILAVCQHKGRCCDPSPIVIDVKGENYHLTDAPNGVTFDIQGKGFPIRMGWTAPGYSNAFLALDRNENGKIDDGTELFGSYTPQPVCALGQSNGFAALKVFDQPDAGGNGDGVIDSKDAIWLKLKLWIDVNHDGVSQKSELHSLDSLGVHSISLTYGTSSLVDQYGNEFRFKGLVNPDGQPANDKVKRNVFDITFTQ